MTASLVSLNPGLPLEVLGQVHGHHTPCGLAELKDSPY